MTSNMLIGALAALATAGLVTAAHAGTFEAEIKTHKMTGAVNVVDGAKAILVSSEAGIAGSFATKNLKPGHVYTMWVAIINKPEACAAGVDQCTGKDLLTRSDAVDGDVTYGDGLIVGEDGAAEFRTYVPTGKLGYSWLGNGLNDPTGAEIHFALHDHGPLIEGEAHDMMSTARGGCLEDSLPEPWPASARAGGKPGPNQCQMAQFAILKQR